MVQTYASGDLVVLVLLERQHGEVGGLPPQDWDLRVTLVYRSEGSQWRLVHRHADPLVMASRPISWLHWRGARAPGRGS
jgi:ketosteroid isomerase-like protein